MTSPTEMIWVVEYSDGSTVPEYDLSGCRHSFNEVDLSRVRSAAWIPVPPPGKGDLRHNPKLKPFKIDAGADLVLSRRMEFRHMAGLQPTVLCYIIGNKDITYLLCPDGSILRA